MAFQAFPPVLMQCQLPQKPNKLSQCNTSSSSFNTTKLFGTWNMIASTSSMWNMGKSSIHSIYSEPRENPKPGDLKAAEFASETSWLKVGTDKKTISLGYSRLAEEGCTRLYYWRGATWLRLITTKWEVLGFGNIDVNHEADDRNLIVLVTWVQKTSLSPQALSILANKSNLDEAGRTRVTSLVCEALKSVNWDPLSAEVDRLQIIL